MSKESPRIAIAVDNNMHVHHGTEISTRNIVTRFKLRNAKFSIISPFPLPGDLAVPGIVMAREDSDQAFPYHRARATDVARTVEILQEEHPDAVILTTPNFYIYDLWRGFPQPLKRRTALLWRMHADTTPAGNLARYLAKSDGVSSRESELLAARKDMIAAVPLNLAISDSVARSLMQMGAFVESVRTIPTQIGNDFSSDLRFGPDNPRSEFLGPRQFGILGVGRLVPEKRWDWVVGLYAHLRSTFQAGGPHAYDEIKISVAGGPKDDNGYYNSLLDMQAAVESGSRSGSGREKVQLEWLGYTPKPHTEVLLNAYDLGALFMGDREAYGRVTIDALSCGLPVMGNSASDSSVSILGGSEHEVGQTFSSPAECAEYVLEVMNDPDRLRSMQVNASRYGATFTLEKAESAWWDALDSILVS